ncbi:ADP-ribosyltransferase [Actinomycetospora termitidis]|uniref:ADP-ribosyltransferase n=1 Tax=Actinomycetospora termitidis TaxID=3053470 RepID=A0ABT7MFH2_9PSEU|nr:ADP-ribosyltransferase [Actinomycetospora sp. Odt1-22]MDL5159421.1 ADP-ribosyltransferase [Actinomycetospora sp. Odt1-22]
MSTPGQSLAFERAEKRAQETMASGRFTIRELKRGLIHVIDNRTSDICLALAADNPIVGMDEEFDTLIGPQMDPPFHDHCRTLVVLVVPGDVEPHGAEQAEVQAEERAREEPPEQRRPSRTERRKRRREVQQDVERRRREERERRRREREARRGTERGTLRDQQRGQGFASSDGLSSTPKSTQSRDVRREGDGPLPAPIAPQRTTLREWVDTAAELNRAHHSTAEDDEVMRILLRRQRWTREPVVVDQQRFRAEAANSGTTLHRGIAGEPSSASVVKPKRSYTPAELVEHYRENVTSTYEQRSSLSDYVGGTYVGINDRLRFGASWVNEWAEDDIRNLDSLLAAYSVPANVQVARGVSSNVPDDLSPGDVFVGAGYQSTNLGTAADEFSTASILLNITVPAGTPAIVVRGTGVTFKADEDELILGHGTRYLVQSEERRGTQRVLYVVALPPEAP